ncbi:MAG: isochorismate synthase MenF [Balneolaceae bacterium]
MKKKQDQFKYPGALDVLEDESFRLFLLNEFQKLKDHSPVKWISVTLPVPAADPLAVLEQLPEKKQIYFWDNPELSVSIAAAGSSVILKATGKNRFDDISRQSQKISKQIAAFTITEHSLAGPLFVGGYSFSDHNVGATWKNFGAARFVLPEWILIKSGHLHLLTVIIPVNGIRIEELYQKLIEQITCFLSYAGNDHLKIPGTINKPGIIVHSPDTDYEQWEKSVQKAKWYIRKNRFKKIVLARQMKAYSKNKISPTLLIHNLRLKFPTCYNFMISEPGGATFAGATPERLASFQHGRVLTEGLAGSISRGKSASEDAALANHLMKSTKDRSEHEFVVRAIHETLLPFSREVEHPETPQIKKLDNVQHLYTPITATTRNRIMIHQLVNELHPTPAVGGFPAKESLPYLNELEHIDRGWYAGPVGWFNLNGSGEFAVAIRSALLKDTEAILYAGCGIVKDSDPKSEWEETELKLEPVLRALKKSEIRDE